MRKVIIIGCAVLLLAVAFLLSGGAPVARAQEGEVPVAHAAMPEYKGPETCAICHPGAAQEVVESLHYQHQGAVPYREGWDEDVLGGMYVTY